MKLEDLPDSAFPDKPQANGKCLVCGRVRRRWFSWFCCWICENEFLEDFEC